ncbi:uncharacterized protein LOC133789466 [Humulus lupulus]|uniref:uncharacterized protein LOC133789466 n=1 Tax=Humulus lupulus TaxID=3486 RepID=UPI002B405DEB|nr:uncharacterized protein LOC133789466 [Humulus lupulus]
MEGSHNDSNSKSVCEKIFCCFSGSTENDHSQNLPESIPTHLSEKRNKAELEPQAKAANGEMLHYAASGVEQHAHKQGNRSGSDVNKAFSDYINNARIKIRAMSSGGGDGGGDVEIISKEDEVYGSEKKADANDMFADYINRSKLKIRKTSSIGSSRRMISFRK